MVSIVRRLHEFIHERLEFFFKLIEFSHCHASNRQPLDRHQAIALCLQHALQQPTDRRVRQRVINQYDATVALRVKMKAGPKRCFTIDNRAAINLIGTQARPDEIHIELIHRLLQHLHIDTTNKLTAKDGLYFVWRKLICRLTKEWRSITRYQASNRVRLRVSLPLNQR